MCGLAGFVDCARETPGEALGAIAGGYFGAVYARRLDARAIRAAVLTVAVLVTVGFFARVV